MSATTGNDLEITVREYLRDWHETPHQLVDVREQDEWDEGHIGAARLIPLGDLAARAGELDAAQPVAIICRSGRRSLMAAEYLQQIGFASPASIAGGMIAWAEAGQPVAR